MNRTKELVFYSDSFETKFEGPKRHNDARLLFSYDDDTSGIYLSDRSIARSERSDRNMK